MPPETPSFPSTAVTWMFVLYPPTFPPHHPSFLGEISTPVPRRCQGSGACGGVPGPQLQSRGQQEQQGSARGCQLPQATVPLRAPALGLPLHVPGAQACGGLPWLQAQWLHGHWAPS